MKHFAPIPLLAGAALFLVPQAASAGFLDEMFGMRPPAPAPYYQPAPPQDYYEAAPVRPRHRKHVAVDAKPQKQQPTDLMHDATLQNGDAVMTKSGMRIFIGDGGSQHDQSDFAKIDEISGMPKQEGREIAALDPNAVQTADSGAKAGGLASGRSAATGVPITPGYRITDARGRSVRYVGP